jgi:DNA mismatch repair protein MutS
VPDLDRALSRLALERGGPRDLASLRDGLARGAELATMLPDDPPEALLAAARDLIGHDALAERLGAALVAEPPHRVSDGGFVASGIDADLDEVRTLRDEGRGVIAGLQAEYAERTGAGSL